MIPDGGHQPVGAASDALLRDRRAQNVLQERLSETGVLVVGGSLNARVACGDGWLWVRRDVNVDVALGYYEAGEL